MRSDEAINYLLEAVGKDQKDVSTENPFKENGFDGEKGRLGWARTVDFSLIRSVLSEIEDFIYTFDTFIFVGMGGSVNGMKPLLSLYKDCSIYTIDSLDPAALAELKSKIKNLEKTLVIPISKSGTTKETQLISSSLKLLFGDNWQKHFMLLADPSAFVKLDGLGWEGVKRFAIQFDGKEDIGGRFSCPQTLIFMLPLYILLKKDFDRMEVLYTEYTRIQKEARTQGAILAAKHQAQNPAYFCPIVSDDMREVFASWLYQLFQESIGSKKDGLAVKTVVMREKGHENFISLPFIAQINNPAVYIMAHMYFFQCFVAFYAAYQNLNFVNQEMVEKYKAQMRKLEGQKIEEVKALNLRELIVAVKASAEKFKYIDIVLYFHAADNIVKKFKDEFAKAFPGKNIIVVIGSDWNHHSYQAAAGDKETFFTLVLAGFYDTRVEPFGQAVLTKNVDALKTIAKATYLTIQEKSALLAFEN